MPWEKAISGSLMVGLSKVNYNVISVCTAQIAKKYFAFFTYADRKVLRKIKASLKNEISIKKY